LLLLLYLPFFSEAETYYEENNYLKAIEKYSKVIDFSKKNANFYCIRSECYAKLSMWIESFEDAKMSFEINKNMIEAYEQAAIALKNLNKIDLAIEFLKRGISVDKNPNPFENKKNFKMLTLLEEFENDILKKEKLEKEKIEILNKIIIDLQNENNNLKIENKNFKNLKIKKEKRVEIINLNHTIQELKNNNNALKTDNNNLIAEINNLKNEIYDLKSKNK
jgi:tetratricopeptide (TPR) repeat protein